MLLEIKNDLLNISKRLKQIDKNYFLVRNTVKKRFEVHYKNGLNSQVELVFDYDELDNRIIDKVNWSRVENMKNLIEQMEKENEKFEKEKIKEVAKNAMENLCNEEKL